MNRIFITFLIIISAAFTNAGFGDNLALRGYIRETPMIWQPVNIWGERGDHEFLNLAHARLNARWYASSILTFGYEHKLRLINGNSARNIGRLLGNPYYKKPLLDLESFLIDEDKTVLISTIDRFWCTVYAGDIEMTFGRQRIAWGTNLVWNTIDIFNPASPLDFDNEEKPGTNAVRIQYYFGPNSKLEFAVSPYNSFDAAKYAFLLKLNKWSYDWVGIVGSRDNSDVFGFAWAGSILGGGFRGEYLLSRPDDSIYDNISSLSFSGDYTFSNTLYLHAAMLYNSIGETEGFAGDSFPIMFIYDLLSPSKLSFYGQIAYDITPLVRADLSAIYNPYDHSNYLGPSLSWSVITNFDLMVSALIFSGDPWTEFGDENDLYMARLKYSF